MGLWLCASRLLIRRELLTSLDAKPMEGKGYKTGIVRKTVAHECGLLTGWCRELCSEGME